MLNFAVGRFCAIILNHIVNLNFSGMLWSYHGMKWTVEIPHVENGRREMLGFGLSSTNNSQPIFHQNWYLRVRIFNLESLSFPTGVATVTFLENFSFFFPLP